MTNALILADGGIFDFTSPSKPCIISPNIITEARYEI